MRFFVLFVRLVWVCVFLGVLICFVVCFSVCIFFFFGFGGVFLGLIGLVIVFFYL